jgi:RNA polymerase sigma-70 factor (ECF subfamily)
MSISLRHSADIRLNADYTDERYIHLVQAIAHADEVAFKEFYSATINRVYGLALALTKSPDIAEDVVVEVFLQVWRTAEKYDCTRGRPLTWLRIMSRSRAIDAMQERACLSEQWVPPGSVSALEEEPEYLLAAHEQQCSVARALRQLSTTQQRLIELSFFRGLSHGEIAATIDMPLGTVKTHIRKGLKTLELLLADGRFERT